MYEAPPTQSSNEDQALKAARVLSLAQDTADRLTGTAKAESDLWAEATSTDDLR